MYEAKTHLSRLLDQVEQGETITITRHGVPVARMVPAKERSAEDVEATVRRIRQFRKGTKLGGIPLRDLIDEGRRR